MRVSLSLSSPQQLHVLLRLSVSLCLGFIVRECGAAGGGGSGWGLLPLFHCKCKIQGAAERVMGEGESNGARPHTFGFKFDLQKVSASLGERETQAWALVSKAAVLLSSVF